MQEKGVPLDERFELFDKRQGCIRIAILIGGNLFVNLCGHFSLLPLGVKRKTQQICKAVLKDCRENIAIRASMSQNRY